MAEFRPVVFCGPSGAGKSTLLKRLMTEFSKAFAFSVPHTTRNPRDDEVDGKDYNFITKEEMFKKIEAGDFLEHSQFADNYYGISKQAVVAKLPTTIIETNKYSEPYSYYSNKELKQIFFNRVTLPNDRTISVQQRSHKSSLVR